MKKSEIRKKILKIRKKVNYNSFSVNFKKIFKILKKEKISGKILGAYYPFNHEYDIMPTLREFENKNYIISLPKIKKNFEMNFFEWSFKKPLIINNYGIPEPSSNKKRFPDILLVPLVAFDKFFNRVGYGGGFYDRYISKIKREKKLITIGFAYPLEM